MQEEQFRDRLHYRIENFMARSGKSIFISLVILFILGFSVMLLVREALILIFPGCNGFGNIFEHMWVIFLEMTDPGNMGIDSGASPMMRISAMLAGLLGVIIFSMLIAFITTQLEAIIKEQKKGHSKVIESGQTLILGWNERVLDIIRELVIANESKPYASIVVLAEREKEEMDDEIRAFIPDTKTTRVITRTGNTASITKLLRISAHRAKSAIILGTCSEGAPDEDKRKSDAKVLKTIMALIGCQQRMSGKDGQAWMSWDNMKRMMEGIERKGPDNPDGTMERTGKHEQGGKHEQTEKYERTGKHEQGGKHEQTEKHERTEQHEQAGKHEQAGRFFRNRINIVAELFFGHNRNLLTTFESDRITSIDSWEILGKILVQTSRTSGLAAVYDEMLSFEGCELYFYGADWGGMRFYDLTFRFPDGVPMGIRRADGTLVLRPDRDAVMEDGDEVLMIAEDDSTIRFSGDPVAEPRDLPFSYKKLEKRVERELILGWHSVSSIVVREYADYLMEGSTIDFMIHNPTPEIVAEVERLKRSHGSMNISLIDRDPLSLEDLASVYPFKYDNVIILSRTECGDSPETEDSETLVTLLLLRKIFRDRGLERKNTQLITQVLNSENQELVTQTNVDDFLISNRMITRIFAQLSEEANMKYVYDHLFMEMGHEIYLKPALLYFASFPAEVTFADIIGQAHKRDEICIGVRFERHANDTGKNFGLKLHPRKDAAYSLGPGDSLVVLSEDEL